MIRGLYSAATAMDAADQNHEVVASNLAHANVAGFRRRGVAMETFDSALAQVSQKTYGDDLSGTHIAKGYSNFEAGPISFTGNSYDVALSGDAFFVVQGPTGPLYTRNGTFQLSSTGELQTKDGRAVRGTAGNITIPPTTKNLSIGVDGSVSADGNSLGKLDLARFDNPGVLIPVGTTLFAAPPGVSPGSSSNSTVQQGYREGSNVEVVSEMVSMIAGMRHSESAQRALRALSEAIQLNTKP